MADRNRSKTETRTKLFGKEQQQEMKDEWKEAEHEDVNLL